MILLSLVLLYCYSTHCISYCLLYFNVTVICFFIFSKTHTQDSVWGPYLIGQFKSWKLGFFKNKHSHTHAHHTGVSKKLSTRSMMLNTCYYYVTIAVEYNIFICPPRSIVIIVECYCAYTIHDIK